MKNLLRLLTSVRLAVALILILAAFSLAGVLLPQIPPHMSVSPDGYAWWVENVAFRELGGAAHTLAPLGFFHMFRSAWFITVTGLLMANILACTAARIRPLRLKTKAAAVRRDEAFYGQDGDAASFESAAGAAALAEKALRARRFTVRREEDADTVWFAADKHRLSPLGTLLVHLSLIVLLIGVLAGAMFGFRNESFTVSEGTTSDVGYGTGLSVRLDAFADTYWEDGTPRDYQSGVTVYDHGEVVKTGVVRVNHPLSVKGIRFHQEYFGPAAGLTVTNENGDVLFAGAVALTGIQTAGSLNRPKGVAVLPEGRYSVVILGSAGSVDTSIGRNQIGLELYDEGLNFVGWLLLSENSPAQLDGMTFAYQARKYSGFTVSREPGAPFLWVSAALFLSGLTMLFYFPHKRLWLRLSQVSGGAVLVTLKTDDGGGRQAGGDAGQILKALGYTQNPGGTKRDS